MKIGDVEARVGVTQKNIRFYEEEGLLRPRRNAGNGYRDYSEQDVARLQRIKLLRKLDVPLAEIRTMLEGRLSLAEGMRRHAVELESRQKSLSESLEFCRRLERLPGMLDAIDPAEALQLLEQREEQGVRFVNIEKTDHKAERYQGAVLGAVLFIALMAFVIGILVFAMMADPGSAPPLGLMLVLIAVPVACIVGVLVVLIDRIQQIGKGEEDAYRNY